jgi:hypothetical protein
MARNAATTVVVGNVRPAVLKVRVANSMGLVRKVRPVRRIVKAKHAATMAVMGPAEIVRAIKAATRLGSAPQGRDVYRIARPKIVAGTVVGLAAERALWDSAANTTAPVFPRVVARRPAQKKNAVMTPAAALVGLAP